MPQESILSELWQFTPEQVSRMQRQRGSDLFFQAQTPAPTTNGPVAAPATNGAGAAPTATNGAAGA